MEALKKVWEYILYSAKAVVAVALPILAEAGFDILTKLQESGDLWLAAVANAIIVWFVPNRSLSN